MSGLTKNPQLGACNHFQSDPLSETPKRQYQLNLRCGGGREGENARKVVQNAGFPEKFHDNNIWKICKFIVRNFVVIWEAPTLCGGRVLSERALWMPLNDHFGADHIHNATSTPQTSRTKLRASEKLRPDHGEF